MTTERTDSAANVRPDVQALRDEIRQTRAELGDTVQALTAKADVKARVKESAAEARERVRESAVEAGQRVKESAVEAGQRVMGSAAHTAAQVKDSAEHAVERARRMVTGHDGLAVGGNGRATGTVTGPGTRTTGTWRAEGAGTLRRTRPPNRYVRSGGGLAAVRGFVEPVRVRQRLADAGRHARRHPGPWLAVAGAGTAVVVFLAVRGRRL